MTEPNDSALEPRAVPPAPPAVHPWGGGSTQPAPHSHGYGYAPDDEDVHLRDYWRVLVRHRWTVLSVFAVTMIVATVWTFTTKPVFTGTATLRIEREAPKVLKFEEVVQADREDDYYQTQYKILQSRSIANRVIGMLALDEHPQFAELEETGFVARLRTSIREQIVRYLPMPPPPPPEGADDLIPESPLTRAFLDRLSVRPVRNARLVEVSFESHHPELAARVPNAVAEAFIAQNLDQKVEATRAASQFLAKQADEARTRLEEAEGRLTEFLRRNDILLMGVDGRPDQGQDLVTRQLATLSDALLEARTKRIEREGTLRQALARSDGAVPAVLGNPVIARLKEQLVTLEGEYRKLGETFKPEYPRMRRLAQNIREVRRQLDVESRRVVESLNSEYRAALRTEEELQKAVDGHRALVARLGEQMAEYRLLRRDVETNQGLYTSLLTRLKETGVSASLLTSNIAVVDRAEVPSRPSKPRRSRNLLLAAIVGLFGGVGLAFFREYLDTSIKDVREVETVLHLPTLAVVPSRKAVERQRSRRRSLAAGEEVPFALIAHRDMASLLAESFRSVRTSLLYSSPDRPPRTLMFTSLQPADGKTSLATNLAVVLGQLGVGDVLLVDADMRKPRLHEVLEVPQAPGLSTYLTGQTPLDEAIRATTVPSLYVMPSGQVPPNPAELLASARFRGMLADLEKRFVHVVVDCPPIFGVADALILAPRVEGVILVLRHGRAGREAAQRAVSQLASVRARLLGVVLNDVDVTGAGYYYGGYGYYRYGERESARTGGEA